jgi:hypothetical protein
MNAEIDKIAFDEKPKNGFHHKNGYANGHAANGKVLANGDINKKQSQENKIRDQVSFYSNFFFQIKAFNINLA